MMFEECILHRKPPVLVLVVETLWKSKQSKKQIQQQI